MKLTVQPVNVNKDYYVAVDGAGTIPIAYLIQKGKGVTCKAGVLDVGDEDLERAAVARDFSYELIHSTPTPAALQEALYRFGVIDLPTALTDGRAQRALHRCYAEAVETFLDQLRKENRYE